MYNIIKDYCNNPNNNGLLLLDMPTGSGKTYSVLQFLVDAIKGGDQHKLFFITTLKKNLPTDELRKMFDKAGLATAFKEKFLFVDANSESVISGLTSAAIASIPSEVKKSDEYKALEQYAKAIAELRTRRDGISKSILSVSEEKMRSDIEPKFRRMLQMLLAKKFLKLQDRLYAIKTDPNWQWVEALYPTVFMRDKQIIFMSMDKFLSQNSTIVEPSCMLYNSDFIKDAVIFIDEFDATKATVLQNIIQNGLRDRIDYVELFQHIYSALHTHIFPSVLTTPSDERQNGPYKDQTLQSVVDGIIEKAEQIYKAYSLQFSHKTEAVTDDNIKNFLFQDHQYHSVLDANKSFIAAVADKKRKINLIQFTDNKPENDENNIHVMLGKLRGFVSYFLIGVNILAINYLQAKSELRQPYEDEFSMESAIQTVLAEFGLNAVYTIYLTSQIMITSRKAKGELQGSGFDLSFYERGFRYYSFEDSFTHDMQSKIMMYSFQTTPEKLLLRFCEKAKVLGISATATIPTAIGNYDLAYIREKLQDKYVVISDEEKARLRQKFDASIAKYESVRIHTELLGCDTYSQDSWRQVAENEEAAAYLYQTVETALSDDNNSYNKERYLRIAIAFRRFLEHAEIKSFLCVLTKHPRYGDKTLDLNVIKAIFKVIGNIYALGFDTDKCLVQLDGEEYDTKKNTISNRLEKGEKLFVISVYQTIGAGQNLQYPVPAELRGKLIKINEHATRQEKDFDAIYLDKPTFLLVQLGQNLSEEDFVKYIYHIEMMQEIAEISAKDAISLIKKAFRCYMTQSPVNDNYINIYHRRSVVLLSTRLIIQAIGRICRTNLKSPDIYIFADRNIATCLDTSITRERMFNREFTELSAAFASSTAHIEDADLEEKASLTSVKVNKTINSMLREDWTDDRVARWKLLRDMVLKFPTLSREDFDSVGIAYNFYAEMPSASMALFYTESADYNNIQVHFSKTSPDDRCVSADAAKLTELMKIDFLRKHFERHGWATTFAPNKYIMCPPLFNNIYRGALGEVVGKALFYSCVGVTLEDIDNNDLFELFDYRIPETDIYVDFKNWHETSRFDNEQMMKKIISKAKECNAKCVIIANILAGEQNKIRKMTEDGIEVLILPSLLCEEDITRFNRAASEEIRRCIREYSDSDQQDNYKP